MRNIAQWKRWFADSANLITPVRLTADISRAKAEGKTGEDQVGYVRRQSDDAPKVRAGVRRDRRSCSNSAATRACISCRLVRSKVL